MDNSLMIVGSLVGAAILLKTRLIYSLLLGLFVVGYVLHAFFSKSKSPFQKH